MRLSSSPPTIGDSLTDVVEYYYRYLSRNADLASHFVQFKKRLADDPKAAEAEAVVFSLLRAEKLSPGLFEDVSTGGPDFRCTPQASGQFLVEVTSMDSNVVAHRSGLPARITGSRAGAYGLITDRLLSEAKNKAPQLGRYKLPGVLAITTDHDFASLLLDRLAAEYLMTSAPQINVPFDGRPEFMSTDLRHSVFCRPNGLVDGDGVPTIVPCRQSISAILLIAIHHYEVTVLGLLHPNPSYAFDPLWFQKVPFVRFQTFPTAKNIATEWVPSSTGEDVAVFRHRRIR